jgi:hypothetical protein
VIQSPTFNGNNEVLGTNAQDWASMIRIYPNPTHDVISIKSDLIGIHSVAVYNLQGQRLLEQQLDSNRNVTVDLHSLSNGIYLVELNKSIKIKIIKN